MIRREYGLILYVGSVPAYYLERKEVRDARSLLNHHLKNRRKATKRMKFNTHLRRRRKGRAKIGHQALIGKKMEKDHHQHRDFSTFKRNPLLKMMQEKFYSLIQNSHTNFRASLHTLF